MKLEVDNKLKRSRLHVGADDFRAPVPPVRVISAPSLQARFSEKSETPNEFQVDSAVHGKIQRYLEKPQLELGQQFEKQAQVLELEASFVMRADGNSELRKPTCRPFAFHYDFANALSTFDRKSESICLFPEPALLSYHPSRQGADLFRRERIGIHRKNHTVDFANRNDVLVLARLPEPFAHFG